MQFGSRESRRLGEPEDERMLQGLSDQELYVQLQVDGTPPVLSTWWFGNISEGPSPSDIAIYILFVLSLLSLAVLFMQQRRFKGTMFYL